MKDRVEKACKTGENASQTLKKWYIKRSDPPLETDQGIPIGMASTAQGVY